MSKKNHLKFLRTNVFFVFLCYNCYMNNFGKTIRQLRLENGLTQASLAKELYTTQRRISYLELGKIEPDIYFLHKTADYFDVSVDFLLGRKDY